MKIGNNPDTANLLSQAAAARQQAKAAAPAPAAEAAAQPTPTATAQVAEKRVDNSQAIDVEARTKQ